MQPPAHDQPAHDQQSRHDRSGHTEDHDVSAGEFEQFEVRTIRELAHRYHFTAPDGFVGIDGVIDYGPPILLADSLPPRKRGRIARWLRLP